MTNEADKILTYLRARDLPVTRKAADLIEQLQRERDEARDRLAQAERDADIREDFAHDYGHDEGFRAAIESAAEKARIHMLGMSKERSDKMQKAIRALSPSDKPAAPSVAEAARVDQAIVELEAVKDYAEQPLYNHLEVGFRHNPLTNAETLDRYKYACEILSIGINAALRSLNGLPK